MNDGEVFGFVPGKYSIDGGIVGCGDLLEGLTLADLVDDFFDGPCLGQGGRPGVRRNNQASPDRQPVGGEVIPGFQFFNCRVELGGYLGKSISRLN